ncbi:HEAT repeat domain-containing protein, partial [candidate division KSB1 bacterium]
MSTKTLKYSCIILLVFIFTALLSSNIYSQEKKYSKAEIKYLEGDETQFDYILKKYIDSYYTDSEAALTLGRMGKSEAVKYLAEAILNNAPSAENAVTALGMIKDKKSVPALIRVIREDRDYSVKAINIITELKDERAIPVLKYVVQNKNRYYLEALDALGQIGDRGSSGLVLDILKEQPEVEPEKIYFKIEHPELNQNKINRREKIINVSEPSADILNYTITYDNVVKFSYQLSDFDSDTLDIQTHYSINNGRSWQNANPRGKLNDIPKLEYRNSLFWTPEEDAGKFVTENILFRIVPVDDPLDLTRGFPGIERLPIDTSIVSIKDLPELVNDEVPLYIYNPVRTSGERRDPSIHYSLNSGASWALATVQKGLPVDDTLVYHWQSLRDLPGTDVENVILRVSTISSSNLGRSVFSNKFHLDNNVPPTVEISSISIDENNIVDIDYILTDPENDPLSMRVEYSIDEGISWVRATISGTLENVLSKNYQGRASWYYDFDLSDTFSDSVRVRLTPSDNNIGFMNESSDFVINQIRSLRFSQGKQPGEYIVKYSTDDDIENYAGKYSTDGGRTWKDASLLSLEDPDQTGQKTIKFDWDVDNDILGFRKKLDYGIKTIKNLKNPFIIPDLIKLST